MSATRVAVLRFPGTLDHESAARAVEGVGGQAVYAHHEDTALPEGTQAVVIPGGFSYGDHLRPGALRDAHGWLERYRRHWEDNLDRLVAFVEQTHAAAPAPDADTPTQD